MSGLPKLLAVYNVSVSISPKSLAPCGAQDWNYNGLWTL